MMIGTCESRRSSRQTSKPEPSGSITSSRTRSGSRRACSSASATDPATSVSKPSLRSTSASGSRIEVSSSTRRIVRFGLLIAGL